MIIGISGKMGSGKDTVADHLIRKGLVDRKVPLAGPLKDLCHTLFNVPLKHLYGTIDDKERLTDIKVTSTMLEMVPELKLYHGLNLSVRQMLQVFGTNIIRRFYSDAWINAALNSINNDESIVISDIRFKNEVKAIQDMGGIVIRLTREPIKADHESENQLDGYEGFNFIYNNKDETEDQTKAGIEKLIRGYKENNHG